MCLLLWPNDISIQAAAWQLSKKLTGKNFIALYENVKQMFNFSSVLQRLIVFTIPSWTTAPNLWRTQSPSPSPQTLRSVHSVLLPCHSRRGRDRRGTRPMGRKRRVRWRRPTGMRTAWTRRGTMTPRTRRRGNALVLGNVKMFGVK